MSSKRRAEHEQHFVAYNYYRFSLWLSWASTDCAHDTAAQNRNAPKVRRGKLQRNSYSHFHFPPTTLSLPPCPSHSPTFSLPQARLLGMARLTGSPMWQCKTYTCRLLLSLEALPLSRARSAGHTKNLHHSV